jgi:hypothetical protein
MKVILTEEQFNLYKKYLLENISDEGRQLPKKAFEKVQDLPHEKPRLQRGAGVHFVSRPGGGWLRRGR